MKIDLLFPVYNESEVIIAFCRELEAALELFLKSEEIGIFPEIDLEIIFIDDGSTDDSVELLSNFNFSLPVRIISLSRNFGHQPAVWAGIENSRSDSHVIVMDCDLQDPPSEISNIILEFQKGNEIVLMRRKSRQDKWAKKASANLFYLLQRKIANEEVITNVGDFYGLGKRAKDALLMHSESIKYIRGMVSQLGFKKVIIDYAREERRAGITKYSIKKMFSLALAGLTGFSIQPLIWVVYSAVAGVIVGTTLSIYVVYLKLFSDAKLSAGWAFASVSTIILSVLTLLSLAVVSLYLGRVIQEIKKRPLYIVSDEKRLIENNE